MTQEILKTLNPHAVDIHTLPVNHVFFPPDPDPGGMLIRSLGMPSRINGPPSIWDTHGISGNVFAKSTVVSSAAPYPQELNPWSSHYIRTTLTHQMWEKVRTKHQFRIRDARVRTVSQKLTSSLVREILQKIMVQTNKDCRLRIFIFDKFTTPATFACWKIRFNTEVCTCSQFPTEAMLWIKEVEMVDSVDDLKPSCSARGFQMPNFEVLDAKIASALNRIIHNT